MLPHSQSANMLAFSHQSPLQTVDSHVPPGQSGLMFSCSSRTCCSSSGSGGAVGQIHLQGQWPDFPGGTALITRYTGELALRYALCLPRLPPVLLQFPLLQIYASCNWSVRRPRAEATAQILSQVYFPEQEARRRGGGKCSSQRAD